MSLKFDALPYPNWASECHHIVLYRGETFTLGAGGTPPFTTCGLHKHTLPTCVVSAIDTAMFNIIQLLPPEFDIATAKRYTNSFSKGDCFTQSFPDPRLVHSFGTTDSPGAFFAAELNVRVMETDAPCASIQGDGVKVVRTQQDRFWSTLLVQIEPGAQATVSHASPDEIAPVHPLGTLVLQLTDPMNEITVKASNQRVASLAGSCSDHEFEARLIEYQGNVAGDIVIRNNGQKPWTGTLLDIFGTVEP